MLTCSSSHRATLAVLAAAAAAACLTPPAAGQGCQLALVTPPTRQALNGSIRDLAWFDAGDGSGPMLYVCGSFTSTFPTGPTLRGIARIGPAGYEPVGDQSVIGAVTIEPFEDRAGPALWVGYGSTARSWSATGGWSAPTSVGGVIMTLEALDLGDGPALFAGTQGGGIFRLTDGVWARLGTSAPFSRVQGLEAFDPDGDGPLPRRLFAAGAISLSSTGGGSGTAMWDGAAWTSVPASPAFGWTKSILAFDDGTGLRLHWGSHPNPSTPINTCLSRWDGSTWTHATSPLASANPAYAQAAIDMGPPLGPRLFSMTDAGILMSDPRGPWNRVSGSPTTYSFVSLNYQGTLLAHHTVGGNVPVIVAPDSSMTRLIRFAGCPRCDGDRNLDGAADATDLFNFLDEWFAQPTRGVQQLFNFLNVWFAGCP